MSTRDQHVTLLVNCLNMAAGGCAVGVIVTLPLAALTSTHVSGLDQVTLEIVCAGLATVLHGFAHLILWRFG